MGFMLGKYDSGTGLCLSIRAFQCQYHSTAALYPFICYQHYIITAIKTIIKQQLRKPQLMLGFVKMKETSSSVVVVMMMLMSILC